MEFFLNLPEQHVDTLLAVGFLAFLGIMVTNIYSRMWVWLRILLNAALIAIPFLAVELLADAAGWAKPDMPDRFVLMTLDEGQGGDYFLLAREVILNGDGYDVGVEDPRLFVYPLTPEQLDMLKEALEGGEEGADPVITFQQGWGQKGGEFEQNGWNLPPKS